jgi:hypothetical protein
MVKPFPSVLWELYNLEPGDFLIQQPGSGHINQTYILQDQTNANKSFVLQQINQRVFKRPEIIASNIRLTQAYLKKYYPEYLFIAPLPNQQSELLSLAEGEYWRLLPFVPHAKAFGVLTDPVQAYEAAKQFGKLSRLLSGISTEGFEASIPRFHDLEWRKEQFDEALDQASPTLKEQAAEAIEMAQAYSIILTQFQAAKENLPLRIMHHDTKISNVLLDAQTFKGICVIDLDTLMPGYFISDLGDMMRTYLCAVDENETDLSKILIREDFFKATVEGYLSEMATLLSEQEKEMILFSGKYIIYMQALRFLTDFLQGSKYYPILYPDQNLNRTYNQFQLLKQLKTKEKELEAIINKCLV